MRVRVRVPVTLRDDMKVAMPYAALGHDGIRERLNFTKAAPKDGDLQTVVVVEMHVQRGNREFVMAVLLAGEPLGQIPCSVLVDIGERGHARVVPPTLRCLFALRLANKVTDCL